MEQNTDHITTQTSDSVDVSAQSETPEATETKDAKKSEMPEASSEEAETNATQDSEETEENEEQESEELESKDDDDSDEDSDSDDDKDQKPKKNKGYRRRLKKLNSRLSEKDQEIAVLKARLEEREGRPSEKDSEDLEAKPEADGRSISDDPEPDQNDYEDLVQWNKDWNRWDRRQENKAQEQKAEKEKLMSEARERFAAHKKRADEYAKKNPEFLEAKEDFEAEFGRNVDFSIAIETAVIDSENGPEIFHELMKNPEKFKAINSASPMVALKELAKIEAKIEARQTSKTKPETKLTTKAPAPLSPVKSKGSNVTKPLSQLDPDEYMEVRREQMKSLGR